MKLIVDNNHHNEFISSRFISGNFLQSSMWRDFLGKQGLRSWRTTVLDDDESIVASCLFYEQKLIFDRSYLYAPKGPIVNKEKNQDKQIEALQLILSKARDISIRTKKQEEVFFKIEFEFSYLAVDRLEKAKDIQPRDTWVLDLDKDLQELLAGMHAKTRYNIALANKKNVKVRFSDQEKDLEHFFRLNKKTASRNQITTHSEDYYRRLFNVLVSDQAGELAIAEIDGQVIAVNILIHFGKATTYLHGASDYDFRKYMAPHILQYESIKRAKDKGNTIYDFWGIAPEDGSKPNWDGFTRFKKSFGGRAITSPGAYHLIYDNTWYNLYNLGSKLKSIIKR